jgi:hypothetical protein
MTTAGPGGSYEIICQFRNLYPSPDNFDCAGATAKEIQTAPPRGIKRRVAGESGQ